MKGYNAEQEPQTVKHSIERMEDVGAIGGRKPLQQQVAGMTYGTEETQKMLQKIAAQQVFSAIPDFRFDDRIHEEPSDLGYPQYSSSQREVVRSSIDPQNNGAASVASVLRHSSTPLSFSYNSSEPTPQSDASSVLPPQSSYSLDYRHEQVMMNYDVPEKPPMDIPQQHPSENRLLEMHSMHQGSSGFVDQESIGVGTSEHLNYPHASSFVQETHLKYPVYVTNNDSSLLSSYATTSNEAIISPSIQEISRNGSYITLTNNDVIDQKDDKLREPKRKRSQKYSMTPETAKRNRCKICNKQFLRPSSLKTHHYSHTGVKIFKCSWEGCGKLFSVKSNMFRHYKIHVRDATDHQLNRSDSESSQN